jgi:hypothetical protein
VPTIKQAASNSKQFQGSALRQERRKEVRRLGLLGSVVLSYRFADVLFQHMLLSAEVGAAEKGSQQTISLLFSTGNRILYILS